MKLQIVEVFEVYVKSITDWNLVEFLTRFFFFLFLWESIPYFAILIFQNESISMDMCRHR